MTPSVVCIAVHNQPRVEDVPALGVETCAQGGLLMVHWQVVIMKMKLLPGKFGKLFFFKQCSTSKKLK